MDKILVRGAFKADQNSGEIVVNLDNIFFSELNNIFYILISHPY